ncbi:uncharacterized protein LOC143427402 [Xylocopa sonorina]|uniref:uncharacterized protein LOC143427402 n=1 Tax=Xylocopa sonorina TaxID=1818115 RepID=UPI00403A8E9D
MAVQFSIAIHSIHSRDLRKAKMFAMKFLVLFAGLIAASSAFLVPAAPAAVPAALTVGTYASSYNAHAINHAVAAPYIASPLVAHAAAPLAYSSLPAATLIAGRR